MELAAAKDLMQLIAEISVAFAGFAGVVAAFSTFRVSPEATAFRVRIMVGVAVLILVASILPLVVLTFGASESAALRISALVFGLAIFASDVVAWRSLGPLYRDGLLQTRKIAIGLSVVAVLLAGALLLVAAGAFRAAAAGVYVTALFFGIILCCYYFFMMMLVIDTARTNR